MRNSLYLYLCMSLALTCVAGDEWPQWRGPDGQGHAQGTGYPQTWDGEKGVGVTWRTQIPGRGWSSPVVLGGQAWVTTAIETYADLRLELAHRRRWQLAGLFAAVGILGLISGTWLRRCQLRWIGAAGCSMAVVLGLLNEPLVLKLGDAIARLRPAYVPKVPTPRRMILTAIGLDVISGRIQHEVPLFEVMNPAPIHAFNSYATPTPVIEPGRLYAHFGTYGTACVDTSTGHVLWRQTGITVGHEDGACSSLALWQDLILFHADGVREQSAVALDKNTGTIRWQSPRSGTHRDVTQQKAYSTPLVIEHNGRPLMLSASSDWLYGMDPATGQELWKYAYPEGGFSMAARPVIGHGMVYVCTAFPKPELLAVKLPAGDQAEPELAWRHKKGVPNMSSPILVGDEIYFITEGGIVTCLDARTGVTCYQERLHGKYRASPSWAEGKLYFPGLEGSTHIIPAGRHFQQATSGHLSGHIQSSPAFARGSLFIRTDQALYSLKASPD